MKIKKILSLSFCTALIAAALQISGASAWGPERTTFTVENPADYPTFNSITNDPHLGDERNFVRIREAGVGAFVDSVNIVPGKTYEVQIYFHNNAKSSLNAQGKGAALNSKVKATVPSVLKKGQSADVSAEITSSNTKPARVYDHSRISSPTMDVALRYIEGSAKIESNGAVNGRLLTASQLFGDGHLIGYNDLSGVLPGCFQYSGRVLFKFVADYADFNVSKTVSEFGKNAWGENVKANASSNVDFKIHYKNTGTTQQNNVNIKDILPKGMTLVKGTTKLFNNALPNGKVLNDDIVTSNGINIGDYARGAEGYITFTAKIADAKDLVCGVNTLTNTAQIRTNNGGKQDGATVTVTRNCTPQEKEFCQIPGKTHLKKDDPKCKEEKCDIPGKTNLDKNDPNCKNGENCAVPGKESLKPNDPNCFEPCEIKGKENLKKNDPNCAQIPDQLPQTGPAEAAIMIIAVVALSGAVAYYVRSRQELKTVAAETETKGIKTKIASKIDEIKSKLSKK